MSKIEGNSGYVGASSFCKDGGHVFVWAGDPNYPLPSDYPCACGQTKYGDTKSYPQAEISHLTLALQHSEEARGELTKELEAAEKRNADYDAIIKAIAQVVVDNEKPSNEMMKFSYVFLVYDRFTNEKSRADELQGELAEARERLKEIESIIDRRLYSDRLLFSEMLSIKDLAIRQAVDGQDKAGEEEAEETQRLKTISNWISSPHGQTILQDAYERTKKCIDELIESRKIDQESLNRPFDK